VLGNTANTYSGLTTISAGTLVGSYGATGSVQSTLSPNSPIVINGGLLQMSGTLTRSLVATAAAGTGTITLQATGGGFASDTEKLTVNIGGQATPSTLSFNSGGFFNVAAANLTLNSATSMAEVDLRNNLDLTGTAHTITVTNNPTTGTDFATISGVISNSGATATLTIAASNTFLQLFGANTYAGVTAISSGTLTVNSLGNSSTSGVGTSVGTSTGANLVANAVTMGATVLRYVGPGETSDRYIQMNGAVSAQIHADGTGALILTNVQQGTTGAKSLYLRGASTAANAITSTLANDSGGGVLTVIVDGGATWILSGNNAFTGDLQDRPAKPASVKVRVRALKNLKAMVAG
jgi:autotransporter-associated beta strand protein